MGVLSPNGAIPGERGTSRKGGEFSPAKKNPPSLRFRRGGFSLSEKRVSRSVTGEALFERCSRGGYLYVGYVGIVKI